MNVAVVTDSTSDLTPEKLERYGIHRVPLYVGFRGETLRDWEDVTPEDIVKGVAAGAGLPSTSQPSPEDFAAVYREAEAAGADQILVVTLSADLSGTYQSATMAAASVDVPVEVFDGRVASAGHGAMARYAAEAARAGADLDTILKGLAHMRDSTFIVFTVATLDYLQKGGRIGRAGAFVGSLLNIKPILTLQDGKLAPLTRARGLRKALQEMVARLEEFAAGQPENSVTVDYIHVLDLEAVQGLQAAVHEAGIPVRSEGFYEIGAVLTAHVGPGTFGLIARSEPG